MHNVIINRFQKYAKRSHFKWTIYKHINVTNTPSHGHKMLRKRKLFTACNVEGRFNDKTVNFFFLPLRQSRIKRSRFPERPFTLKRTRGPSKMPLFPGHTRAEFRVFWSIVTKTTTTTSLYRDGGRTPLVTVTIIITIIIRPVASACN